MPLIAYSLPNWVLGVSLVLGWILCALAVQALFPNRWRQRASDTDRNVALAALGVIATINSLLLAFSAVSVWDSFGTAEQAVQHEATAMAQLGRTLTLLDDPHAKVAREHLRAYGRSVVTREWDDMQKERPSQATLAAFDAFFNALGELRSTTPADTVLLNQVWQQANDLLNYRRARLQAAKGKVPATLWGVVVVGSALTLLPLAVPPVSASSRGALLVLGVTLGLVFHFVAAMDRPFLGTERVTAEAIEDALSGLQKAPTRPAKAPPS